MLDGLKVTKTADKMVWAAGVLTYTITVTNSTAEIFTSPVITDVLDKTLVTFVDGSVTIDGQPAATEIYSYDEASGKLTINLSNIAHQQVVQLHFKLRKQLNSFFHLENICVINSNNKEYRSNLCIVESIYVYRKCDEIDCTCPYWRR